MDLRKAAVLLARAMQGTRWGEITPMAVTRRRVFHVKLSPMYPSIQIVMLHTRHPGNIGAVARAMKNMCLESLVLVAPDRFPSAEAEARASGADDLLQRARVCASFEEAIADSRLVIGTSARPRGVPLRELDPRECAEMVRERASEGPVSIVFGRETSGLTNEELARCAYLVRIPANTDYTSLNVAMAAQVICYELHMAMRADDPSPRPLRDVELPASGSDMETLFQHLEQTLIDIRFADQRRSRKLMLRLRRLLHDASPSVGDVNLLHGILSAAQGRKSMRREGE